MFAKKKGTYRYLKKAPVSQGLFTLLLLLLPAGIFLIGYSITGSVKNLFTVVAVVGMLPAARNIVSFIMYLRAEKYSCSSELHEEVCIYEKHALIGYDYYLTSYSVNYPLSVCCVGKGCLIGLTEHPKLNAADCEAHITEYLKKNEIPDLTVKIYTSKGKFIDRLKNIAEKKDVPTAAEEKAFALLSSLSL